MKGHWKGRRSDLVTQAWILLQIRKPASSSTSWRGSALVEIADQVTPSKDSEDVVGDFIAFVFCNGIIEAPAIYSVQLVTADELNAFLSLTGWWSRVQGLGIGMGANIEGLWTTVLGNHLGRVARKWDKLEAYPGRVWVTALQWSRQLFQVHFIISLAFGMLQQNCDRVYDDAIAWWQHGFSSWVCLLNVSRNSASREVFDYMQADLMHGFLSGGTQPWA